MRGVVILLMMLDHVRERFYMHVRTGDPIADTIEADLFFTRYLTHFCAPIFIFLAGVSAWLYAHPTGSTYRSPSRFLFKRGLVIIMIELVLYYLVWADSFPSFLFLQVLWAIGLCMIWAGGGMSHELLVTGSAWVSHRARTGRSGADLVHAG